MRKLILIALISYANSILIPHLHASEILKQIKIEITVPACIHINEVTASIPALKYNKKLVSSWTVDDSYSIYNQIFSIVNKKWVDNELMSYWNPEDDRTFFYHLNGERTNGYIPKKALEYTDGCGIAHRFAASVACWPWQLSGYDQDVSKFNLWVSSKEIRMMQDFGYSFCFHDLMPNFEPTSQVEFDQALAIAADSFQMKTGRIPKIMIEPNGDHNYVTYSLNNNIIESSIAQNIGRYVYPFKEKESLEKDSGCIIRYFDSKPDDLLAKLSNDLSLPENQRKWYLNGSHRQSIATVSYFFQKLDSLYGAHGQDCVWVPSVDEYVEYSYLRNHATIDKSVSGNKITFTLSVPIKDRFWFQSLSLLISGITDTTNIKVSASDNAYGLSYGVSDKKLLVNIDFNDYLPEHAEKYTAIFEQKKTTEAYEDALYFISQLKKELQTPYKNRINSLTTPPSILSFTINKGKSKTSNTLVSVAFEASSSAVYYRLSESPNFEDTSWKILEPSTVFRLSPEPGTKKIYLQLKNALYQSPLFSTQIELLEQKFKLVVGFSGNSNENETEFINEEILNNASLVFYDGYTAQKLYDISGNEIMKLAKNKSDISNALNKYGISEVVSRTLSAYNPSFTGNLGAYPDKYYSTAYFFGADSVVKNEKRRLIAGFIDVPEGTFNVRILASQNKETTSTDYLSYRYQVNNSDIYIPDSDIFFNNQNSFIEFKNVSVKDSVLLVCSWREPYGIRWGYYAPMNLIEISKASAFFSEESTSSKNTIQIYSGKGKITITNNDLTPFSIYSIEGREIKHIIPESETTDVYLSKGLYFIGAQKALVY